METNGDKRRGDFLTALRLLGVFVVPFTWFIQGTAAVGGLGGWLLLLFWTTDLFDGRLARKSGLAGNGFWGRSDRLVDMLLTLSSFTLLGLANVITPLTYLLVVVVALVLYKIKPLIFQPLTTFFITSFYFLVAFGQNPAFGVGIGLFLGMHALFSRERFGEQWQKFFAQFK